MSKSEEDFPLRLIQGFLRQVFTENCSCFDKTCEISFAKDSVVANVLRMFRILRNSKTCVTFFEKKRRDHASIINEHIDTFLKLDLLSYKRKTFFMANDLHLSWENIKSPHQSNGCFCGPLEHLIPKIEEMYRDLYVQTGSSLKSSSISISASDIHEFARALFWYFRKAIVDNLVQHIYTVSSSNSLCKRSNNGDNLEESDSEDDSDSEEDEYYEEPVSAIIGQYRKDRNTRKGWRLESMKTDITSCHALSVGSTNITSDYDVTLYGNCVTTVIQGFHNAFERIFNEPSAKVFDTNLYGSSFIEMPVDIAKDDIRFYERIDCSSYPKYDSELYYYVKGKVNDPSVRNAKVQQHIWALLKLKRSVNSLFEGHGKHEELPSYYYLILDVLRYLPFVSNLNAFLSNLLDVDHASPTKGTMNIDMIEENDEQLTRNIRKVLSPCHTGDILELYEKIEDFHESMLAETAHSAPVSRVTSFNNFSFAKSASFADLSPTRQASKPLQINTSRRGSLPVPEYNKLAFSMVSQSNTYTDLLNTISMFNFYGLETYYTRGAFLHVVFIMQTCKGKADNNLLDTDALIDSFIENYADYLSHGKEKYLNRMLSALRSVKQVFPDLVSNVLEPLETLDLLNPNRKDPVIVSENVKKLIMVNGINMIMNFVCKYVINDNLFENVRDIYTRTAKLRSIE